MKLELKDKIYIFGLTLIIASFIACVISFYLLIYGIPVYLLAIILVLISKRTLKTKILTTLTPVVLYVPLTYLFLLAYNYSTPKTILIPSNYEGTLRIVYEEKCGSSYDEINGTKTLIFPKNGILILSEDFDRNIDYNYYLIDKFGNKKKISSLLDFKNRIGKMPCVIFGSSGTIGQSIEANSPMKEKKGILFSDLYVFNKDTIDRNDFKYQAKFDSLTTEIVNKCRMAK